MRDVNLARVTPSPILRISSVILSIDGNLSLNVTPSKRNLSTLSFREAPLGCDKFKMTLHLSASFDLVRRGEEWMPWAGICQKALKWLT